MAGRPKGSTNKVKATVGTKEVVGKVTLPKANTPIPMPPINAIVEVQRSPLHVSASVGACFKTGRVGITSLSIQVEYEKDVLSAVDDLAERCLEEWDRLAKKGLTQIVPDTYYGDLQQKSTKTKCTVAETPTPELDDIEAEFDAGNLEEVDSVQNVSTVEDGVAALDEIEKTAEINKAKKFDADNPVEIPTEDEFDALAAEFEDDVSMNAVVDDAPNITEEIEEPVLDANGEPELESDKLEAEAILGFEGAEEEGFDVGPDGATEEGLEENGPNMICVFDLSPEEQREELKKRNITEVNGVPVDEAPEPDIVIALDEALEKEQG